MSVEEFERKESRHVFKDGGKQILLIGMGEKVFAIDNRCPHEGYPLAKGTTDDENCSLTCNWHNWKFDLATGKCFLGGDNVQTYPLKRDDRFFYVDTSGPSPERIKENIFEGLGVALARGQYGRMGRELARLDFNGIDPIEAVKRAILFSYPKFEFGMTHAYAALADWLHLYDGFEKREDRLICLNEALDHIAKDALRHDEYPFSVRPTPYSAEKLERAVEEEDEKSAASLVLGALKEGMGFSGLKFVLSKMAFRHYADFGHSLIYVQKAFEVSRRLNDPEVDKALVLSLVRSFCYQTREDLLPEFDNYQQCLLSLKERSLDKKNVLNGRVNRPMWDNFKGKRAKDMMDHIAGLSLEQAGMDDLLATLYFANAFNFLHYDMKYQFNNDGPVTQNVGWLSFTHAMTFSNAVRVLLSEFPCFYEEGILQMGCFYGRNVAFTCRELEEKSKIEDAQKFRSEVIGKIMDHGIAEPIVSAHLLKTAMAVFSDIEAFNSQEIESLSLKALDRFLKSPIKRKFVRRSMRQGLKLVEKDFK